MTDDAAAARLRADLARQILAWMNDAFAQVDFEASSDKVVEKLTLAWSEVVFRIEAVDLGAQSAPPSPQSVHKTESLTEITTRTSVTMFDSVD